MLCCVEICRTILIVVNIIVRYNFVGATRDTGRRRLSLSVISAVMVKNLNRSQGGDSISTYQEFTIILGIAMLIVSIVNMDRKK